MRWGFLGFFLIFILALGLPSCSLVRPVKIKPDPQYKVKNILTETLRVRRPKYRGANPKADPGTKEYKSEAPVGSDFDCRRPGWMLRGRDLLQIRQCLLSFEDINEEEEDVTLEYTYRLIRKNQPYFELEGLKDYLEDKEAKDEDWKENCMYELLAQIPVPREIFYQSLEGGEPVCYSSRLGIEGNRVFGVKTPLKKFEMKIRFPLRIEESPNNNADVVRLLVAWGLTPFFGGGKDQDFIPAKKVPDMICNRCLGRARRTNVGGPEDKPLAPAWSRERKEGGSKLVPVESEVPAEGF